MSKKLTGTSLAGSSVTRNRVEDDYYATPIESTQALLNEVLFEGTEFLEPCCGGGHIAEVIKQFYPDVNITALDIADRGYGITGIDFLKYDSDKRFDAIITNPPYSLAKEFIEHSLDLLNENGKIAMFLKIQFLEGVGRQELFDKKNLKYVYVFRKRQNPMRNGMTVDEHGKPWASTMCFAWFIFEKSYSGEPIIRWL